MSDASADMNFVHEVEEHKLNTSKGEVSGDGIPNAILHFPKENLEMRSISQVIKFLPYYTQLRFYVAFGFHQTPNPLDLRWRLNYWKYKTETSEIRPDLQN